MNTRALRILRYSFVVLFLWFGVQQLMDPGIWVGFLPTWTGYLPIPGEMLVQLNGWFEIIAAIALAAGLFTRWIALILGLHLFMIAWEAGGAIGMRDLILGMIGVTLFFSEPDEWTLDHRDMRTKKHEEPSENFVSKIA